MGNDGGPGDGTAVQRWVDPAMYVAEPVAAAEGPRVYLLGATPDPLGTIAASGLLYQGVVVRSTSQVTHAQRREFLEQLQKTKIKAPLEFVQFHFLIEGVTRGFTHQLVRQRTATFVQESTRFAVKEDMPVGLPPSLAGTTGVWRQHEKELYGEARHSQASGCVECDAMVAEELGARMVREGPFELQRWSWDLVQERIALGYKNLVNTGMPAEDARGLLPTNVLTRIHYSTDLRALLDHAGNRLCTQAQFEWRLVFAKMAEAIRTYNPYEQFKSWADNLGHVADDNGFVRAFVDHVGVVDSWQWAAIADLLRPVCYATGKCEFMASFDRACSIRNRVQANAEIGRPSRQWSAEHDTVEGNPVVSGVGPQSVVRDEGGRPVFIGAIRPAEWLTEPGAAR